MRQKAPPAKHDPASRSPGPTEAEPAPAFDGFCSIRHAGGDAATGPWDVYDAVRAEDGRPARIIHYREGSEPDPAVHRALRRLPTDHVPELLATGREAGLRHRDLRPTTVLLRDAKTLDLVVSGWGSTRLSDFDLEQVAPLQLTRYSAPEAIVGAVSAASDWWSHGMIVLEQAMLGSDHRPASRRIDVRLGIGIPVRIRRNSLENERGSVLGVVIVRGVASDVSGHRPHRNRVWPVWLGLLRSIHQLKHRSAGLGD